ncbi:MAG: DUF4326 domain-containing protein [Mesorhizobium sp.]|nr:MAG: DUF4326 domain-containing protein [Mesorhizobium sp.]
MTQPQRIQLSRRKGWRMPENTVTVARPGPWGNPFIVGKDGDRAYCVELYKHMLNGFLPLANAGGATVESLTKTRTFIAENVDTLRGKDLACWCRVDGKPCHADVLLKLANRKAGEG